MLNLDDLRSQIQQPATVGVLLEKIADVFKQYPLFYGHGTENADDEAYALIFTVLDLIFDDPQSQADMEVSAEVLDKILDITCRRVNERMPLPYLTGVAWFASLPFTIDQRALIPRSPFAELIQNEFVPWLPEVWNKKALDLCTGNGCIGIAVAVWLAELKKVDLVDISTDALELARANVERHGVSERVNVIQSDLYESLPDEQYDLIVSNPPYVPASSMTDLPPEYAHEPVMALQADDDGMAIVDRLLHESAKYLTDEGILIIEVGEIADAVNERYASLPFTWLEFEHGGEGVFMLRKDDLVAFNNKA